MTYLKPRVPRESFTVIVFIDSTYAAIMGLRLFNNYSAKAK